MNDTTRRNVVLVVVIAVVVVVAMNLIARGLDDAVGGREPGGADDSSYATQSRGLAAFSELLTRYDHDVRRIRGDVADATLSPEETVVLTDPDTVLSDEDGFVLRRFTEDGGRLLLAGVDTGNAARILDDPPTLSDGTEHYRTFAPELASLRSVLTAGAESYDEDGDGNVLVRNGDRVLALSVPVGAGEVVLLADESLLHNEYLAEEDNAALALLLAGDDGRRVVFAEGVHGYGESTGLKALPSRWKLALLGLVVAAAVYAWARGRRLGPADQSQRSLPPARGEYVDALSGTLARTGDPAGALDSLGAWTRRTAATRAGLPPDASDDDVDHALAALGLSGEEIDALRHAPRTEAEILALGRAAARVTDGRLTP